MGRSVGVAVGISVGGCRVAVFVTVGAGVLVRVGLGRLGRGGCGVSVGVTVGVDVGRGT